MFWVMPINVPVMTSLGMQQLTVTVLAASEPALRIWAALVIYLTCSLVVVLAADAASGRAPNKVQTSRLRWKLLLKRLLLV